MTTIGQILDNFFSPFSREKLWIMPEKDNYTQIVRTWQPVINAVNQAKTQLKLSCAQWTSIRSTSSSWKPRMTDPPFPDPNSHRIWVSSPPGTDPTTCKNAFIVYATSIAAGLVTPSVPIPTVQTWKLYTCAIGSFGIYTTVDRINCAKKRAKMNFWMYNAMDRQSFGRFANEPVFVASKMERQYMWWNWSDIYDWGSISSATPGLSPISGTVNW